jgi:hypothetical protein
VSVRDPRRRAEHQVRLITLGVAVDAATIAGQHETMTWDEAYLRDGYFNNIEWSTSSPLCSRRASARSRWCASRRTWNGPRRMSPDQSGFELATVGCRERSTNHRAVRPLHRRPKQSSRRGDLMSGDGRPSSSATFTIVAIQPGSERLRWRGQMTMRMRSVRHHPWCQTRHSSATPARWMRPAFRRRRYAMARVSMQLRGR